MRICLIASSRYPIREPFAGGLEAITHAGPGAGAPRPRSRCSRRPAPIRGSR